MGVDYRCTKLEVIPGKTEYTSEEDVEIRVIADVERRSEGVGISFNWFIDIYLDQLHPDYKIASRSFIHMPWTTIDSESWDVTINLGKQPEGPFNGKVIIACAG